MVMRLPENLDLDKVIQNNLMLNKEMKLNKYKLMFVCDAIIRSRARNFKAMEEEGTLYAPLSSKHLDKVVHNYNHYLHFLEQTGVIESDNYFIEGQKCIGYRFAKRYRGQKLKTIHVKDYLLNKGLKRVSKFIQEKKKKNTWGYSYLTKWWDEGKLKIDVKGGNEWIDQYKKERLKNTTDEEEVSRIIDASEDLRTLVLGINEKEPYYSFSGEGHRFYNPISNLKSELRNFLTWDGQPLVNIDIKNSQPYLSLILHDLDFWEKKGKWEKLGGLKGFIKDIRREVDVIYIITLLKTYETHAGQDFPSPEFPKLVAEGGCFYEYIQKTFGPYFPGRFDTRKKTKKEVLRMFYCDNKKVPVVALYETMDFFRNLFPLTYELFWAIKTNRYQLLPILLQRLESYLMIDVICKRISKMDPTIPMFTIHDNIITTEQHADVVKKVMEEELERHVRYKSTLSVEKLGPEQPQPIHQMPTTAAQVQMAA